MSPITSTLANSSAYGYRNLTSGFPAVDAFESISTVLGNGSASSITFSSIPTTYKHLQIRCITRDTFTTFSGNYGLTLQMMGNTGANYSYHLVGGSINNTFANQGNGATSGIALRNMGMWANSPVPSNTYACGIIDIHDYSVTGKTVTVRAVCGGNFNSSSGDALAGLSIISGAFNTSDPITQITISGAASAFTTGSSFALYGIKG